MWDVVGVWATVIFCLYGTVGISYAVGKGKCDSSATAVSFGVMCLIAAIVFFLAAAPGYR